MALRYCFEQDKVLATLNRSKPKDLAVIDTDGIDPAKIKEAVDRGVFVYGYLNIGALEKERSYYTAFKSLRLAKYDGWAVIPKESIEGENPANWHIAEVELDASKEKIVAFNGNQTTCCGRQISKNAPMPRKNSTIFYPKGDDKRLRNNLAFWQNGKDECCGNCVGHFYKDPNGSNK